MVDTKLITVDGVTIGTITVRLSEEFDSTPQAVPLATPHLAPFPPGGSFDAGGAIPPSHGGGHGRSGPTFRPHMTPHGGHAGAEHHTPVKHGPTFRPGLTPRGGAPAEKPRHLSTAEIAEKVHGKSEPTFANVKRGNGGIDRTRFKPEMTEAQTARLAAMVAGEIGDQTNEKAQTVQAETAFNRAQYRGHSLEQALWDTAHHGQSGYYPEKTFTHGYSYIQQHPEWYQNFKTNILPKVLAGSNESDVGYGPMTGNASGDVAAHQAARGTPHYHLPGGDTYFREGPFSNLCRGYQTAPQARGLMQAVSLSV